MSEVLLLSATMYLAPILKEGREWVQIHRGKQYEIINFTMALHNLSLAPDFINILKSIHLGF